ncbi:hypothetical protein LZ554_006372 [Drepanopeziza brunnea f. sp. 'monogermtubi']|nr:hypothetical protein LZ554_006372 [Drepanopeziza brunnea f. sp. 'monogermtubi']
MLNICLIGSGGVGTISSLVLEKSKQAKVTAVLRSNYQVVVEKGFEIDSADHGKIYGWRPTTIASSVEDAAVKGAPYDYVVVALKALPDVYSVPEIISPVVTPGTTTIVLIQNGIDIELPLIEAFPRCTVMSGVSYIETRIRANDVYHESPEKIWLGAHFHAGLPRDVQEAQARRFVEVYAAGGPRLCVYAEDIQYYRWRKLFWNGAFNTLCTLTGCDVGRLQDAGGMDTLLRPLLQEIHEITKAKGFVFEEDMIAKTIRETPPTSHFRPSMQVDLEKGNPLELYPILGGMVRHAEMLGVEAPILRTAFNVLKVVQWRLIEDRKNGKV